MLILLIASLSGFGLLGVFPKSVNSTLRYLVAPAVGLLVFGEFNIFYSFIFGFGMTSMVLSLLSESLFSIVALLKLKPIFNFEKVSWVFIVSLFAVVIPTAYILYTRVLFPSTVGFQTGGGGLYGDTALHLAYTARIQTGEFPPQNPLFAGRILVYPFANDLLSAALRIDGMGINFAFILPQIIFLIAFLTLFYTFARKFTSEFGYLISLSLISLGWGVGFIYFLRDFLNKNASTPFLLSEYTNNSQYNLYFHNIFTGLILPERSFLPSLFLGLWIFLNYWEYFKTKSRLPLVLNSILIGILPFWHVHTFIFVLICSFILMAYSVSKNFKQNILFLIILSIISLALALPFLFLFLTNQSTESFFRFVSGWQRGDENILIFWFKNSYLVIPMAILGLWKLKNNLRIYFVGPIIAFLVTNFIIFQPWAWDNIKLLTWSFLFFAILSGVFLSSIFQKGIIFKCLVILIIFTSCMSGLLSIILQFGGKYTIYDKSDIELADWVKDNSRVDEIFLIDPVPNHPIPSLAGRLVYSGYAGHLWVHGINYYDRDSLSKSITSGNLFLVDMAELPISYIVLSRKTSFSENLNYRVVFENNKYTVLKRI